MSTIFSADKHYNPITFVIAFLFSFLPCHLGGQGGLMIGNGVHFVAAGNPHLVILDGKFYNDGIFAPGNSTVSLQGAALTENSTIGGSAYTPFHHLTIGKSAHDVRLDADIQVDGLLTLAGGLFDLNGHDLRLNGSLQGETETTRVTGPTGGELVKTVVLDMPAGENPGNLGLALTSGADLGPTTIRRGHMPQQSGADYGIERYFEIEPGNNIGPDVTLRFYFFDSELSGLDENNLKAWQYDNNAWQMLGTDHSDMDENWVEVAGVEPFSLFTLAENFGSPLPIELLFFRARVSGDRKVDLFWATTTEINNDFFTIERSKDGTVFESIGTVPGAGTTAEQRSYQFLDNDPLPGLSYYRLRQTDFDGSFTFSPIRVVHLDGAEQIRVFPNPAGAVLNIQIDRPEGFPVGYALYNQWGQEMVRGQMDGPASVLPIGHLSSGVYILQLRGRDKTADFRVVKK